MELHKKKIRSLPVIKLLETALELENYLVYLMMMTVSLVLGTEPAERETLGSNLELGTCFCKIPIARDCEFKTYKRPM